MSLVLGLDAKLYIDESAGYAGPDWGEVKNAMDVTLNLEGGEANVSTRGSGGWEAIVATLKRASVDFKMLWDTNDVNFTMIKDAFLNRTAINVAAMDGVVTTPGSQGLRAVCIVSKFTRNEALEEALTVDVTLKPTYFPADEPEWLVVA